MSGTLLAPTQHWLYQVVHVPDGTLRSVNKQDLLAAVIGALERDGIGDRSLRDIAAAVGTSHRMLIHYFGSRHGLLTEVVRSVEAAQHDFLADQALRPEEAVDVMWRRLSDPKLWPAERLFFECYARACHGEQPYASLLPGLVDDWLDQTIALGQVRDAQLEQARARVRLSLAVFRGLLLDLVGTEDREGVDAAFAEFRAIGVDRGDDLRADRHPVGD
jgi:AcrR family transcriptional regulator